MDTYVPTVQNLPISLQRHVHIRLNCLVWFDLVSTIGTCQKYNLLFGLVFFLFIVTIFRPGGSLTVKFLDPKDTRYGSPFPFPSPLHISPFIAFSNLT